MLSSHGKLVLFIFFFFFSSTESDPWIHLFNSGCMSALGLHKDISLSIQIILTTKNIIGRTKLHMLPFEIKVQSVEFGRIYWQNSNIIVTVMQLSESSVRKTFAWLFWGYFHKPSGHSIHFPAVSAWSCFSSASPIHPTAQ